MTSVVFENEGLVPLTAIRTMGVSAKEGDNPIGMFGTGLKYAIAILLRTGHTVRIYRGLDVHCFGLRDEQVRGQDFRIVQMDGEDLGFTDQLGKNWENWQAYRELYCNTLDEGGSSYQPGPADSIDPVEGVTKVVVTGADIVNSHSRRDQIVLSSSPIEALSGCEIHAGNGSSIYYRGIAAGEIKDSTLYTYNVTTPCTLTEDRTFKFTWEPMMPIKLAIVQSQNEDFIRDILGCGREFFEGTIDFSGMEPWDFSKVFDDVMEDILRVNPFACNQSAMKMWRRKNNKEPDRQPLRMTPREKDVLADAMSFCADRLGADNITDIPCVVVQSLGPGIMGMSDGKLIWLTRKTFDMGRKQLIGTLYEEWCHHELKMRDESRTFQNHLIDRMVTLAEEKEYAETNNRSA